MDHQIVCNYVLFCIYSPHPLLKTNMTKVRKVTERDAVIDGPIYRIRPNYRTVRLGFSIFTGNTHSC